MEEETILEEKESLFLEQQSGEMGAPGDWLTSQVAGQTSCWMALVLIRGDTFCEYQ